MNIARQRCDRCEHFMIGTDSGAVHDDTGMYGVCLQADKIGVKAVQLRRPEQNVFVGPQIIERGSVYVKPSFGCNKFDEALRFEVSGKPAVKDVTVIDRVNGMHQTIDLDRSITIDFVNIPEEDSHFVLVFGQDAVGGHEVRWPAGVSWRTEDGNKPRAVSKAPGDRTLFTVYVRDGKLYGDFPMVYPVSGGP